MINQINDTAPDNTIERDNCFNSKHQKIDKIMHDSSKQIEAIKSYLNEISEVNEARVLYFKSEIALGNYAIDSHKIAMKMLHEEPA